MEWVGQGDETCNRIIIPMMHTYLLLVFDGVMFPPDIGLKREGLWFGAMRWNLGRQIWQQSKVGQGLSLECSFL